MRKNVIFNVSKIGGASFVAFLKKGTGRIRFESRQADKAASGILQHTKASSQSFALDQIAADADLFHHG
jgi:hypothetical protein